MNSKSNEALWSKLSTLRQRLIAGMEGGLTTLASLELTVPQAMVLFRLVERGPLTISALQIVTGRSQAATSHLVAQLERRGLVKRSADATDARRTQVQLTAKARRLVSEVEGLRLHSFKALLEPVPAGVVKRFDEALDALLTALEERR